MEKEKVNLLNFSKDLFVDISSEIMQGFEKITLNIFDEFVNRTK